MPNERTVRRIAIWSGPRNISTAMMRSWSNRADTVVVDEPFYAFYLRATGKGHPGATEVMENGVTDWRNVVEQLTGPFAPGCAATILYQKQMTHHLLPQVDRHWLGSVTNCFLIRDPREVIVSYMKRNGDPKTGDLGFTQQASIFEWVCRSSGKIPPVIDARDVVQDPARILRRLCQSLAIEFDAAMLEWPSGPRATDGVWAKYWYGEVEKSTSFQPYREKNETVPERLQGVQAECRECYDRLYQHRLH